MLGTMATDSCTNRGLLLDPLISRMLWLKCAATSVPKQLAGDNGLFEGSATTRQALPTTYIRIWKSTQCSRYQNKDGSSFKETPGLSSSFAVLQNRAIWKGAAAGLTLPQHRSRHDARYDARITGDHTR